MARESAQEYVPPKGDTMGSNRSSAVKNAINRSAEDEARLAGIVRRARGKKADEMAPGVQAEAQKRFAAEQARTAGMRDFSGMADMKVNRVFDEIDEEENPIDIPGFSPPPNVATKSTSDVVTVPGAYTDSRGVTFYRPKGDPFQYQYNAADKSFTVMKGDDEVMKAMPGDATYEAFLAHAQGKSTQFTGGSGKKAPAAEAPEGATGIPEIDQTNDREMDASIPEQGDTAMDPESRLDTSMTADAEPMESTSNTLAGPAVGAMAARGAAKATMAGADELATRGGRMARAAGLKEGLSDAEQLKRMRAAGETRGRISYAQQLMEGKRGSAPSTRAGISKQLIDEVVDDISPDDLSPELRRYYDDFDAKTLRQLNLDPADKYLVARLKQNAGSREAAAAAEFFGEAVDDKAAQSLSTKLRIPSAPTGQQLREGAEGVFRGVRTAAARAAANPGQVAKMAGRGALASMSLVPDPTDLVMLAASAPVLGMQELGASRDFGAQLERVAPRYNAADREPFTLDMLSGSQKQDVREFVLNSPQPLSAAKELLEMRRYITPEALDAIIAE